MAFACIRAPCIYARVRLASKILRFLGWLWLLPAIGFHLWGLVVIFREQGWEAVRQTFLNPPVIAYILWFGPGVALHGLSSKIEDWRFSQLVVSGAVNGENPASRGLSPSMEKKGALVLWGLATVVFVAAALWVLSLSIRRMIGPKAKELAKRDKQAEVPADRAYQGNFEASAKEAGKLYPDSLTDGTTLSDAINREVEVIKANPYHPLFRNPDLPMIITQRNAESLGIAPQGQMINTGTPQPHDSKRGH